MTNELVDEIKVIARIAVWLAKQNWELKAFSIPKGEQHFPSVDERKKYLISTLEGEHCKHGELEFFNGGPDIIAEKSGVCLRVECKGLGKGKPQTLRNNFDRALASVVSYYDLEGIHLGLGFPDAPKYKSFINTRLPDALRKKLNIWIFLLNKDSLVVEAFSPKEELGFRKPVLSEEENKKKKAVEALVKLYGDNKKQVVAALSALGYGGEAEELYERFLRRIKILV